MTSAQIVLQKFLWQKLLLGAAALGMSFGCSVLRPSTLDAPNRAVWREIRSRNFVVQTDADEEERAGALRDLETTYDALQDLLFLSDRTDLPPMYVVLFAHSADLHRFLPPGSIAAFAPANPRDPASRPTMLVETGLSDDARPLFVHEMTHAFVARRFGNVPLWLNEGLAEYFQTMRIETQRVVLGEPISGFEIAANVMPSLTTLLTADRKAFYAGRNAHSVEGAEQTSTYYVAAWYLVHLFMHDQSDYRSRFHDYLDALARGVPHQAAWARSFDRATFERLTKDYLEYLRSESLYAGYVPIRVRSSQNIATETRVMPSNELDALWARLKH